MSAPSARPKIYHITHTDNLAGIVADGEILSDVRMIARGNHQANIGMTRIKARRLTLPVTCHAGDYVGEYVPFNFCPRSVMLYVIAQANHPDLVYRGGQGPILHLEADLEETVAWAEAKGRRWAFTAANAGAVYTDFWASLDELDQLDWAAIHNSDFRSSDVKEHKQAEFLMCDSFPWHLVRRAGVRLADIQAQVEATLADTPHHPPVEVRREWYF